MITKTEILNDLRTVAFGRTVFAFDTIDSTNMFAKLQNNTDAPHGTIVIADEQTEGRGRLHRNWTSQKEKNLLFSVVLFPDFGSEKVPLLPFAGSLAVADAIEVVTGLSPTCKWPNDVLINNLKVCGMLLESTSGAKALGKIVLGIGVNVNQEEFPDELKLKASSLKIECGVSVDRVVMLQAILEALEHRYEQLARFPAQRLLNDWKMKALLFGKRITVLENELSFTATAIDVADDGSLIIQTENGQKRSLFAADVSLAYR